ncbi:MAG: hypothetical protein VXW25_04295, partial [Pseudomonadota bacterium]|nr:hypothetical protein [Pseudomonadota bacterium]
ADALDALVLELVEEVDGLHAPDAQHVRGDRVGLQGLGEQRAASLLGGNYLELIPGADEEMMQPGEVIYDTLDPVSLTDLLGKAVFSAGNGPS